MNQSTNYEFNLPEESDFAKISDLTENWESIDTKLKNVSDKAEENVGLSIVDGKICQTYGTE